MRKLFGAILALAGALTLLMPGREYASADGIEQAMLPEARDVSRAARLRTAQDGAPGLDPDTVWIGHIYDPTFTSGGKMPAGGYGPYRVGRGPNLPKKSGGSIFDNGTWDFDRFQGAFSPGGAESDSLQGWWPTSRPYQAVGGSLLPDYQRSFFGFDYGNQVNYVINQGSPKRTFGVTGLWHRDNGSLAGISQDIPGTNVIPVAWSPTEVGGAGSTASAWMGMRSHGDLSHVDLASNGGTGNPFNSSLTQYQGNNGFNQVGSVSTNGTDHNFPGYGSQMDQMLYRDLQLAEGDGLNISFNFSTNMSLGKNSDTNIRVGWFDKDPLSNAQVGVGSTAPASADGNFISSTAAGSNAPCDSFMVYIGAPVNDNDVTFSTPLFVGGNEITTVYDKKRRWFSEVLQITGPGGIIGAELGSYAGDNAAGPASWTIPVGNAALQAIKDADGAGNGGKVRLVFRVKTNRGTDDENGGNAAALYSSGTRGAAIVDNVVMNGWAAANGNFEATNAINNDTAVDATNAWKSTGKPPAVYFHAHSVTTGGLAFDDPCGTLESLNRGCNLYGKIITSGDHDAAEKEGGLFGSNSQDRQRSFVSPTINLQSSGNGPGNYNAMGIDNEISITTSDYRVMWSFYNAGFVNATTETGNFFQTGWQAYPARQANGNFTWGEARFPPLISFYGPPRACFETISGGAKAGSLIRTSNLENRPDSLRAYIHRLSRCFTFAAIGSATCSPTVGLNVGTYYDNISIAFIDGASPPEISIPIWMLINDAFPANRADALVPAGFDTTAAQIRIGLNVAGFTLSATRPNVSGDSTVVAASGTNKRLDMVFRILPGPGNYMTVGVKSSGVSQRPDGKPYAAGVPAYVPAVSGDASFFGQYMANTGAFGSSPTHPGGKWSQQVWNSARMDTAEIGLFPTGNNGLTVGLLPGTFVGTYHEDDPKYSTLGISHNLCVMVVPSGATNSSNIQCDGGGWGAYGVGSGWNSSTTTKEHTKIIPDGLLTPGSHVQYFHRKSDVTNTAVFQMGPDTNFVFQGTEGSSDGHRWQQFGVLPDRWKDGAWSIDDRNAPSAACMLYLDIDDRRGNERVWVGIADSIGATAEARYGAHNGWHARGDQDITVAIATDPSIAVYKHGGQPGTIWDMYGVKASESSTTSSSLGPGTAAPGFMIGKDDKRGPTGLMLTTFYRTLLLLTGDLGAGNIGPYADKGSDDVGLLTDFATSVNGTPQPRAVWAMGENFVEGQITGGATGHPLFMNTFFGTGLASGDYRGNSGNTNDIADLTPNAPIVTNGSRYSVFNSCQLTVDVLSTVGTIGAVMAAKYADGLPPNPKISSVYTPSSLPGTAHAAVTLVEGFEIGNLGTYQTLDSHGLIDYFYNVMTSLFGALNCTLAPGGPVSVGDNPNNALVNFLALRSENPMRSGTARITFSIAKKEMVELKVYDVTGRLVKTLVNRVMDPGKEHPAFWDGTNENGQLVPRGVYFYQVRTPSYLSQKKLAVLHN